MESHVPAREGHRGSIQGAQEIKKKKNARRSRTAFTAADRLNKSVLCHLSTLGARDKVSLMVFQAVGTSDCFLICPDSMREQHHLPEIRASSTQRCVKNNSASWMLFFLAPAVKLQVPVWPDSGCCHNKKLLSHKYIFFSPLSCIAFSQRNTAVFE